MIKKIVISYQEWPINHPFIIKGNEIKEFSPPLVITIWVGFLYVFFTLCYNFCYTKYLEKQKTKVVFIYFLNIKFKRNSVKITSNLRI